MLKESADIMAVAEQVEGRLKGVSFELVGKARELARERGGRVLAAVFGSGIGSLGAELVAYGADRVVLVDDSRLALYRNDAYALALEGLIRKYSPGIVLFSASTCGSELAATTAARLGTGLAAHCVDLRFNERGEFVQVIPAFGGRVLGDVFCPRARPQMASIRPGVFKKPGKDPARSGETIKEEAIFPAGFESPLEAVRVVRRQPPGLPLEEAGVVVAGGWGVGSAEVWRVLEELAGELGAAVGCTRPALDEGWINDERALIGASGKTVRPKLYIGFGISGSIHHVVGMKDSGFVINVNTDPAAPVFQISDCGVIADAKEFIPLLLEKVRERKAGLPKE
ncbi:MAG TPA: electron transfer flavoprotein subunit alpha/FixB family protein [Bacillota bacterium]|nr:electron transfer flavoprotein subunit alpha/FixB family protein [Bacillota bacterium]